MIGVGKCAIRNCLKIKRVAVATPPQSKALLCFTKCSWSNLQPVERSRPTENVRDNNATNSAQTNEGDRVWNGGRNQKNTKRF